MMKELAKKHSIDSTYIKCVSCILELNLEVFGVLISNARIRFYFFAILNIITSYLLASITWSAILLVQDKKHSLVADLHQGNYRAEFADWRFLTGDASDLQLVKEETVIQAKYYSTDIKRIKVHGLLAVGAGKGAALLSVKNSPAKLYYVGDTVLGNVKVHSVLVDRLLVEDLGKMHALFLPKNDKLKKEFLLSPTNQNPRNVLDWRSGEVKKTFNKLRNIMISSPEEFLRKVSINPQLEGGNISGYSIKLLKDKEMFERLGLRDGDLIRSINEYEIQNLLQDMNRLKEMLSQSSVNVVIERDGTEQEITVNLK
jgi:general secretion pathway protein C